jgi:hypothetical protein
VRVRAHSASNLIARLAVGAAGQRTSANSIRFWTRVCADTFVPIIELKLVDAIFDLRRISNQRLMCLFQCPPQLQRSEFKNALPRCRSSLWGQPHLADSKTFQYRRHVNGSSSWMFLAADGKLGHLNFIERDHWQSWQHYEPS